MSCSRMNSFCYSSFFGGEKIAHIDKLHFVLLLLQQLKGIDLISDYLSGMRIFLHPLSDFFRNLNYCLSVAFYLKGFTVSALYLRGIALMSTPIDFFQCAVVFAAAVILTLMNCTTDRFVCITSHYKLPPIFCC